MEGGNKLMRRITLILCLLLVMCAVWPLRAQEAAEPVYSVYVTAQDYSAVREGPGRAFPKLLTVPPGETLPAIGRTIDAEWIQVIYGEQKGWIAAWLLVWSGNMIGLPADGIDPASFIRLKGKTITVTDEMAIYSQYNFGPGAKVDFPAAEAVVEVTGRLGSGGNYWLQFWHNGSYYWLGAWNLHLGVAGITFGDVPDAAYVYPFGRVLDKLYSGRGGSRNAYSAITGIWGQLSRGESITCNFIPPLIEAVEFSAIDLANEGLLLPEVNAYRAAVDNTNRAIDLFAQACGEEGTERFLTTDTVNLALGHLETARLNFSLLDTLLPPTANRDPIIGNAD